MGVVDRFEKAVSLGVNAPFSKMFASSIKAVDVKTAIRESMDNSRATLSDGRVVVPNEYQVLLNQKDYESVMAANSQGLSQELAQDATAYATEQSYVFVGPVEVVFSAGDHPLGELKIDNSIRRGPAAPVTTAGASPSHPIIDIEGQQWLKHQPVLTGGAGHGDRSRIRSRYCGPRSGSIPTSPRTADYSPRGNRHRSGID